MKAFFAREQLLHDQSVEFNRGELTAPYESGKRAEMLFSALEAAFPGAARDSAEFPVSHLLDIHDVDYIGFLQSAFGEWVAEGRTGDAFPMVWPVHDMRGEKIPSTIVGKISHYSFEISTAITKRSWISARRSAETALSGAQELSRGAAMAFSLCRPPGHHAGRGYFGGYCYLNNAGIAAQYLRNEGASRIAILDVDYHHGNGTQQIFYDRDDVFYVSVHADPDTDFPYFLGYADEKGAGKGEGFNLNIPLSRGAAWPSYGEALSHALKRIEDYAPDALIVSLGVDTSAGDPLSGFLLTPDDFARMGAAIAALQRQTLFVFEGGYAINDVGGNVVSVLNGFLGAAHSTP